MSEKDPLDDELATEQEAGKQAAGKAKAKTKSAEKTK